METKIPYYMAYPMPLAYDDERTERRDYDYMKSIYPDMAKKILPYVEEECDRMSYRTSMIYDEYPDRLQLQLMCKRIYDKVKEDVDEKTPLLGELVQTILFHEIHKRRCDYRKQKRNFYLS